MFPFGICAPMFLPVILGGHHRKILPYDLDGPFKQVIMSLFRLAWSSKIRLPLLITVAFLALDVNLQVEINVFWAAGDREVDGGGGGRGRALENEGNEVQPRRQNANRTTWHATTGMLPPVAPLAQFEEFDDTESEDDNEESDSDSSIVSLPSNFEIPISRYFLPQVINPVRFENSLIPETRNHQNTDTSTSEAALEHAQAPTLD